MTFIPAKCPTCGGALQVPDDKDFVNCMYCSNVVKVRDAIILKMERNDENLLELGFSYFKEGDYREAENYFNKALEIDSKNAKAWMGKAICMLKEDFMEMRNVYLYTGKALENSEGSEREEIIERISIEACYCNFDQENVNELKGLSEMLGVKRNDIHLKIIDVCNSAYFDYVAYGLFMKPSAYDLRNEVLQELKSNNESKYNTLMVELNENYEKALRIRNNTVKTQMSKTSGNVGVMVVIGIVIFAILSVVVVELNDTGVLSQNIGCPVSLIIGIALIIIISLKISKTSEKKNLPITERRIFGNNLLYK